MRISQIRGAHQLDLVSREDLPEFPNAESAYTFLRRYFVEARDIAGLRRALMQSGDSAVMQPLDDEQVLRVFARRLATGQLRAVLFRHGDPGKLVAAEITPAGAPAKPPPPAPASIPPQAPPPEQSDDMLNEVAAAEQAEALVASSEAGSAFCEA